MFSLPRKKKLTHHFFLVENRFKNSTKSPEGKSIKLVSIKSIKKLTHSSFLVENCFKISTKSPEGKSIKKLTHRFFLVEKRFKIPPKDIKSIKILTDDSCTEIYAICCAVVQFIYTGIFLICHKYSNFWRKCRLNRTYPPYDK